MCRDLEGRRIKGQRGGKTRRENDANAAALLQQQRQWRAAFGAGQHIFEEINWEELAGKQQR